MSVSYKNLAKELNTSLHIHLSETLDEEETIRERYNKRGTEYLNDLGVFDVPVILAHGIYISDSDIEILKHVKHKNYEFYIIHSDDYKEALSLKELLMNNDIEEEHIHINYIIGHIKNLFHINFILRIDDLVFSV